MRSTRVMPPKKNSKISDDEKTAFLADLSVQMVEARKILSDSGGKIAMRRLNRREYQNTIKSLLGVRPDVSDLPDDQAAAEFDTMGGSLFFSSDQLEQFLAIARRSLELALKPRRTTEEEILRVEPEKQFTPVYRKRLEQYQGTVDRSDAYQAQSEKPPTEFGFIDKAQAKKAKRGAQKYLPMFADYVHRPETKHGATLISTIKNGITRVKLPAVNGGAGHEALIRVRVAAYKDVSERFRYLEFTSKENGSGSITRLGWRKVTGTLDQPEVVEFPISVPAGKRVQYFVHQRTHEGRGDKNLWTIHREQNGIGTKPGLWVDWADLVRPASDSEPSAYAKRLLFAKPTGWSEEEYVKAVIERFAIRAFRSEEPSKPYLDKLYARYVSKREQGLDLRAAFVEPLSIILASPSFLYMVESSGGDERLTDLELAVRLSYFLWRAPPDDVLLDHARTGRLTNSTVLKAQTSRLLTDARSERFVRSFVYQWLEVERLEMFQFLARLYPLFDNGVRDSAREEIFKTVSTMMDEKLPLRTLLKADFVVVNDLLAGYYGLDGVEGPEFRKVALASGSLRGGLLGSAAVLAMGSDGIRSSPVERGAWVLRHLLQGLRMNGGRKPD